MACYVLKLWEGFSFRFKLINFVAFRGNGLYSNLSSVNANTKACIEGWVSAILEVIMAMRRKWLKAKSFEDSGLKAYRTSAAFFTFWFHHGNACCQKGHDYFAVPE